MLRPDRVDLQQMFCDRVKGGANTGWINGELASEKVMRLSLIGRETMFSRHRVRHPHRLNRLLITLVLVAGLLPAAVSAQDDGAGGPLTPVSVTSTIVEVLDPGQEWTDAEGNFHLRGEVTLEEFTGDIEGMATITFNGDAVITGECNEEECEGVFHAYATIDVVTENGSWDGHVGFVSDFFDDEEGPGEILARALLVGRGENGGKVMLFDTIIMGGEDEDVVTLTGQMLTLSKPIGGVTLNYSACFSGPDTVSGGWIGHGQAEDSGSVSASFTAVGAPTTALVFGEVTFTGARGTINGMFMNAASNQYTIGHFVLLGGTGDYEHLYGYGKVIETIQTGGPCANGAGPQGTWIGQAMAR